VNVKHIVELTKEERKTLASMLVGGRQGVRRLRRARTLLLADAGKTTSQICEALSTSTSTVYRTKKRFVDGGIDHALNEKRRPGAARKLDGSEVALLVATTCSSPPDGRSRWTLQLLADKMVVLTDHDEISAATIGRRLKENELKPWQKRMWVIPSVDAYFVAAMENVLELYTEPACDRRPVVCFDETPVQLIGDTRTAIAAQPGSSLRVDYEYRRNGVANLFVFFDVHRPWRHVKVTQQRRAVDFAHCMRDLVDVHYPEAEKIRVVLDNLNTHAPASLYKAFTPLEARRILRRIEFHHTPKHASWLNMVEIEIGVLTRQCLDRRIPDIELLRFQVEAWMDQRNESGATIEWMFDLEAARTKLERGYPEIVEREELSEAA